MKKLNALNLGKSLNREEMKSILAGKLPMCYCGTGGGTPTRCLCHVFCGPGCDE
jgi:hypothetical protein